MMRAADTNRVCHVSQMIIAGLAAWAATACGGTAQNMPQAQDVKPPIALPAPSAGAALDAAPAAQGAFNGKIKLDVRDSVADWKPYTPQKAPPGSANILFVLYDDTGLAAWSPYGVASIRRPGTSSPRAQHQRLRSGFGIC